MSVPSDLVDARAIAQRYGIERSTAERVMRTLTTYRVPGHRGSPARVARLTTYTLILTLLPS